jgi:DNA-binding transcriptional ArsR family regulator
MKQVPGAGTQDAAQQILSRLGEIEDKVDSVRQTHGFSLRIEREKVFAEVKKIFRKSKRKAQVYLAANGRRSINEIADTLGIKRQNVGRELKVLFNENLVEVHHSGSTDLYRKTPVDRAVGITRFLEGAYSLTPEGKALNVNAKNLKRAKKTKAGK